MAIADRLTKLTTDIESAYNSIKNKKEKILPDTYTQVEYIESTGTQYINTGVVPTNTMKIEVKYLMYYTQSTYNSAFGSQDQFNFFINNGFGDNNMTYWYNDGSNNIYKNLGVISQTDYNISTYDLPNNTIKNYNNELKTELTDTISATVFPSVSMYLFARNNNNSSSYISYANDGMKCWYFKVWNNGTLIRNMIPCYRNSDNVIGMYDLINDVFYTNQGTGTFLKGYDTAIGMNKNTENLATAISNIETIESATAEGESLNLTNTKAMPYKDYVVKGKSEQATRSGKNYFDASKIANSSIVVSDNGKTITMPIASSGNGNTNTSTKLSSLCPNLKVGDIIYLRFARNQNPNRNHFVYLYGSNIIMYAYEDSPSYTISQADLNSYVFLYGNDYDYGETQQVVLTDFRIVKNSTDEWEQYGVSPSPDYPSDINSVADKDINLFNKDTITRKKYINGSGNIADGSADDSLSDYIEIEPNVDYYISNRTYWKSLGLYNSSKTYLERISLTDPSGILNITNTNCKYIRLNLNTNDIEVLKLQKGSTATPYSPYNQGTVTINQTGKNLFDDVFELGGYDIASGQKSSANDRIRSANYIKVVPLQTYTLSFENAGSVYILEYDNNKTYLSKYTLVMYHNFSGSVTLGSNTKYITFYYIPYNHTLTLNEKCQLEQGSTATTYEPYQTPHDYTIQTEPLRSLPNGVKDTIEEDGIHIRIIRRFLQQNDISCFCCT